MNVVARTDGITGQDWVVEVDGVIRARFPYMRYMGSACFLAAREANEWRRVQSN